MGATMVSNWDKMASHFEESREFLLLAANKALGALELELPESSETISKDWLVPHTLWAMRERELERFVDLSLDSSRRDTLASVRKQSLREKRDCPCPTDPALVLEYLFGATPNAPKTARARLCLFDAVTLHALNCEDCPGICTDLRTALTLFDAGYTLLLAQVLNGKELNHRYHRLSSELWTYARDERFFDFVDGFLTHVSGPAESERHFNHWLKRLTDPAFARERMRRKRESNVSQECLQNIGENTTYGQQNGSMGLASPIDAIDVAMGSLQSVLADCKRMGDFLYEQLLNLHAADGQLIKMTWFSQVENLMKDAESSPEPGSSGEDRSSISDLHVRMAEVSNLAQILTETEQRLPKKARNMRWKRKVIRLALLRRFWPPLYALARGEMAESETFKHRKDRSRLKLQLAVIKVGSRIIEKHVPLNDDDNPHMPLSELVDRTWKQAEQIRAVASEQKSQHAAQAGGEVRQLYEDSLKSLMDTLDGLEVAQEPFFSKKKRTEGAATLGSEERVYLKSRLMLAFWVAERGCTDPREFLQKHFQNATTIAPSVVGPPKSIPGVLDERGVEPEVWSTLNDQDKERLVALLNGQGATQP